LIAERKHHEGEIVKKERRMAVEVLES